MMAAILNSANLNLAIFDSTILVCPSQTDSHLPRLVPNICTKKLHWFILTQLDDGSHLEFCHIGFSHLSYPSLNSLTLAKIRSQTFAKKLHWFILTQLDDGSHLEFCHLGFRHLVIFSQIHSKTLSLHSDYDSNFNLTQTHSFWLNLMMAAILNSANLHSAILVFSLKLTHTCQDWFPLFAQKKPWHIDSDSTWWWQSSWIMPSWIHPICIKETSLNHSLSTWWWQPSWILPSWIQTLPSWTLPFCSKLWLN